MKSVLNYKRPAFWITMIAVVVCVIVAICFLTNPSKEYQIRITIPAGSTKEIIYQEDFCYSDEEISPTGSKITISLGEGMGDTEVVLKPIEVKEENAVLQDLAYYLELSSTDIEFQDMSDVKKAEILEEYGELLDGYTIIARESTDGNTSYFFKYDNTGNDAVASLKLMEYLKYVCNPEVTPMGKSITEVSVNTLENVAMMKEKYKSYEGDIEIVNQSGGELTTGEWYSIQRCEDGEWHRLDELIDGIWKEVEYHIPNGETAVFPTNWKIWFGELPS